MSTGYSAMQESVEKNKEGFTKRQVEHATRARSGYHMAGAPDMKVFKLAVRSGLFKNCPIEEKDIVNADKIYGPSVSAIKGKTKRPTPTAAVDDWVEIPRELVMHNEEWDLCVWSVLVWIILLVPQFIWVHSCEQISIQDHSSSPSTIGTQFTHTFGACHIFYHRNDLLGHR